MHVNGCDFLSDGIGLIHQLVKCNVWTIVSRHCMHTRTRTRTRTHTHTNEAWIACNIWSRLIAAQPCLKTERHWCFCRQPNTNSKLTDLSAHAKRQPENHGPRAFYDVLLCACYISALQHIRKRGEEANNVCDLRDRMECYVWPMWGLIKMSRSSSNVLMCYCCAA